jgi:hypothetical protein
VGQRGKAHAAAAGAHEKLTPRLLESFGRRMHGSLPRQEFIEIQDHPECGDPGRRFAVVDIGRSKRTHKRCRVFVMFSIPTPVDPQQFGQLLPLGVCGMPTQT